MSRATVVIDALPESARRWVATHAVVAVDVIRATTTAVTAVALGRRCFPVSSIAAAHGLRAQLDGALLAGELNGNTPRGFDLGNSPAAIAQRTDIHRPLILLSSSGTQLLDAARTAPAVYLACFRNAVALGRQLAGQHPRIAVIGAGSRGEFRIEDQICCAWVAAALLEAGYEAADVSTREVVARWRSAPATAAATGRSAEYLRRTHQMQDLDFVLGHVNDLDMCCTLAEDEIVALPAPDPTRNRTALRA
jgi:2-phosphosulfolactate phosphatase